MDPGESGQSYTAPILELQKDPEASVSSNLMHLNFKCSIDTDKYEEIITYNDLITYIESMTLRNQLNLNSTESILVKDLSHQVIQVGRDPSVTWW